MTTERKQPTADQLWLLPASGQAQLARVADVALRLRSYRTYSYVAPAEQLEGVQPGAVVQAPFGRAQRVVEGFVIRVTARPWKQTLKPLISVAPGPYVLSTALADLGEWVGRYYVCPPGAVFAMLLPAAVRAVRLKTVRLLRVVEQPDPTMVAALTPKQRKLYEALQLTPLAAREAAQRAGVGAGVIQKLKAARLVEAFDESIPATPPAEVLRRRTAEETRAPEDDFALTAAQQEALDWIQARLRPLRFEVGLLFGVPGSGKTEVYIRAIRSVIAAGRQAILLVPEIALATQVVERLARRFERVAILHSQLTSRTRVSVLQAIARGEVDVVIGTRTAVFAPCPAVGLIVVDEEQEGSFKSLAAPFFHARDVAIKRGQLEGVPVLLGSATPALESWQNAVELKKYALLELRERVPGAEPPAAQLVTYSSDADESGDVLAPRLRAALRETLAAGDQAILLHNRRGYAATLRCSACGLALRCADCHGLLVWHQSDETVRCHRCGYRAPRPTRCANDECGGTLVEGGLAIQRLAEDLQTLVPAARVIRLDRDTMRRRSDYEAALASFERREADVLIGTQMVAKGLDFAGVRFVGVIDADTALQLPDFRATEVAFQLLMQVVGRAGRQGGRSLALVQTRARAPQVFNDALAMNYRAFAERELAARQAHFLPPFSRLARLVFADARAEHAANAARYAQAKLAELAPAIDPHLQIGPAEPCVILRLRNLNRHQVLVRAPHNGSLQKLLLRAIAERGFSGAERITIDVDPRDLF